MLGPSGFFTASGPEETPVSYADMELIHSSENGFNSLYRISKNGRFFVYKALKPEFRGNPVYEHLLKKDFDIAFSLNHHCLCQYYGFVHLPEIGNCIIMEWVDGCTLEELILEKRLTKELSRKIICEICDALEYIHHKQVIHRDLKPSNILVTYNGFNVKIIDFGLSDTDSYNVFKAPAGTRIYASPELLAGDAIDARSDLWSLGLIIKEMTGGYGRVVAKCLRRDRSRRYNTASEVKNAVVSYHFRKLGFLFTVSMLLVLTFLGIDWAVANMNGLEYKEVEQVVDVEEVVIVAQPSDTSVSEPIKVKEEVSIKKSSESINSEDLDDIFKQAAEQI